MARVYLLGAHTAVAKALVECLEEREIDIEVDPATTEDHLESGFEPISEAGIRAADLVVLALPALPGLPDGAAKALAETARRIGKPVLDLSGALSDERRARWIFPGLDEDAGRAFDPATYTLIPVGLAAPIVAVLRALAPFEPSRATIATYESTAALDQPGMDELADQVRARFNMREIEPVVFGAPIAFGCIPVVGGPGASPFDADEHLRRAVEAGTEAALPDLDLSVTRILVPTFSADGAVLVVDVEKTPGEEDVRAALRGARGIHALEGALPSSIDAVGRDDAMAGRLSIEAGRVGLWIACDRLRRGSATLAALAIERWLGTA